MGKKIHPHYNPHLITDHITGPFYWEFYTKPVKCKFCGRAEQLNKNNKKKTKFIHFTLT